MSRRDQQDYDRTRALLIASDTNLIRAKEITDGSLKFQCDLWSNDKSVRGEFRQYMADYPDEFKARFTSSMFVLRILAAEELRNMKLERPPSSKLTAEELEKMNLTDVQIEKLAGVNGNEGS